MGSLGAGHYFTGRGARGWAMTEIGCHGRELFSGIHFGMDDCQIQIGDIPAKAENRLKAAVDIMI
jgi:hypothetical protein